MLKYLVFAVLVACIYAEDAAIVKLTGEPGVSGTIKFEQLANGVRVHGEVKGLKPGKHGFHVHGKGDLSNGCASTGTHFNPFNKKHGAPTAEERHVGDLGNIEADANGVAKVEIVGKLLSLRGDTCILGRAIVVHSGQDDLGLGGNDESLKTGNAGSRVACGIIGVLSTDKGVTYISEESYNVTEAFVKLDGEVVTGTISFRNTPDGVLLEGQVTGLSAGRHGFHVHALGDLSDGCASTGSHFNPYSQNHGAPNATDRHVGDLGNIEADATGVARVAIMDNLISLSGVTNIIGRAVVVHADPDDLGLGGEEDSLTTGHAGARLACGIIGRSSEELEDGGAPQMSSFSLALILSIVSLLLLSD